MLVLLFLTVKRKILWWEKVFRHLAFLVYCIVQIISLKFPGVVCVSVNSENFASCCTYTFPFSSEFDLFVLMLKILKLTKKFQQALVYLAIF